jgi:hypothetical protein
VGRLDVIALKFGRKWESKKGLPSFRTAPQRSKGSLLQALLAKPERFNLKWAKIKMDGIVGALELLQEIFHFCAFLCIGFANSIFKNALNDVKVLGTSPTPIGQVSAHFTRIKFSSVFVFGKPLPQLKSGYMQRPYVSKMLVIGSPRAGKTLLARPMPGILPAYLAEDLQYRLRGLLS